MRQPFIETDTFVQSFTVGEVIHLLADNKIQCFSLHTGEKIAETQLFAKEGLARALAADEEYLYCSDFTDLSILAKDSLTLLARVQLGTDLSSDICATPLASGQYVYAAIRNGALARIEKRAWEQVQYFPLSASSMWAMRLAPGKIYAGNVAGELLVIDLQSMTVETQIPAHKQNLKSLMLWEDVIVTAAQDKSLSLWNAKTCERIQTRKNAHQKAFGVIGQWQAWLLTVSFPCGEIKVWDKTTLRLAKVISIAPCLSGQTHIHGSRLYLSSRAINGIDCIEMETLTG